MVVIHSLFLFINKFQDLLLESANPRQNNIQMKLCFPQICRSDHFHSRTCVELCLFFHLGKRAFTLWKSCYFGTRENRSTATATTTVYRSGFVCRVAASRLIYSGAKLGKFSRRFARSRLYNLWYCADMSVCDLKIHVHLLNLDNVLLWSGCFNFHHMDLSNALWGDFTAHTGNLRFKFLNMWRALLNADYRPVSTLITRSWI